MEEEEAEESDGSRDLLKDESSHGESDEDTEDEDTEDEDEDEEELADKLGDLKIKTKDDTDSDSDFEDAFGVGLTQELTL
jgi:hypothetical protein